jgi:protein associated with RNAse G/E
VRRVTVQFLKNPDIIHWGFRARYLGEDDFGSWMAVPKGTERWKGEQTVRPTREDAVFCAPRAGWWHLHYNGGTTEFSHFVDIATPPVWVAEDRYEMIDLDLDVVVRQDGTIEVHDEDEFEIHQKQYGYSEELIAGAQEETRRIVAALGRKDEPFFEVAASWLARLRDRR